MEVPTNWRRWLWVEAAPDERVHGLDTLRGLLALGVAAYHLTVWTALFPSGSWLNMSLSKAGNYGVMAFFMLSGFVLFRSSPWARLRKEGLGRFFGKRFLRLAPVFYLAVGLNVCLKLGMGPEPTPRMLLENLSFTFGAIHPNHALTIGGWYVGMIALFYFLYPALAWGVARWRGVLPLAALALFAWSLPTTLYRMPQAPQWERFHLYVQPGNQLFVILLGGLLAQLQGKLRVRLAWPAFATGLALLLWLFLRPEPRFYDHLAILETTIRYRYLAIVAGIVLLFALKAGKPGPVGRGLDRIGVWSYAIFLLHPMVFRLVTPEIQGFTAFWIIFLGSIPVGWFVTRWIEEPLAAWGGRWLSPPKASETAN